MIIMMTINEGNAMRQEVGATMVEYTLIVALIAIAVIVGVLLFQGGLTENLGESADCVGSLKSGATDCPGVAANGGQ